ncbi:MAG: amidohydrolase family protein [Opitutales bacterium]
MKAVGVIDCHVHHYSADVRADPEGWARAQGEHLWRTCVAPSDRASLQDWADTDRLLRDMDAAGVERVVLQSWYWETPAVCLRQNRFLAECVAAHPDRLSAFAGLPFAEGEEAVLEEARWALQDGGFLGFGELHPGLHALEVNRTAWDTLATFAAHRQVPLLLHVTEPVGRSYPGRVETPFAPLLAFIAEHARTTFTLAHLGGLLPLYALNPFVEKQLTNVYVDIAAVPLLYRPEACAIMARLLGPDRLLFGSDYPLRTVPRAQTHADFQAPLDNLRAAGLDPDSLQRALGANARQLLHLP